MLARKLASPSPKSHLSAARGQRDQLARINRLHMALKATLQPQDLLSIVLACLVSEEGLGFHRAFAFSYDERADVFRGVQAMGPASRQERKQLLAALAAEARALSKRAARMEGGEVNLGGDMGGTAAARFLDRPHPALSAGQPAGPPDARDRNGSANTARSAACPSCLRQAGEAATGSNQPLAMELQAPWPEGLAAPACHRRGLANEKGTARGDCRGHGFQFGKEDPARAARAFPSGLSATHPRALENCELYSDLEQAYTQLQEMDTIKGNFLSVVSHELRSPLTAISGFTEVLLSSRAGVTSEEHRSLLQRIRRQATHLARIVDDLLDMAEATLSPGATLSLDSVDPARGIDERSTAAWKDGARRRTSAIEPIVEGRNTPDSGERDGPGAGAVSLAGQRGEVLPARWPGRGVLPRQERTGANRDPRSRHRDRQKAT